MTDETAVDLSAFLAQQYLCEGLTVREVQTLLDFTELVSFKKDAIIADVGEVGEALYVVVRGEAMLCFEEDGRTYEIGRMRRGELVGEMSFFDREPRSVRLVAVRPDTELLRLSRVMYQRLRVEHPLIAVNLLEHAIISLDHLFRRVSEDVVTFSRYIYARSE